MIFAAITEVVLAEYWQISSIFSSCLYFIDTDSLRLEEVWYRSRFDVHLCTVEQ